MEGPDPFGDYNIHEPSARLAIGAVVSNLRPASEVAANARLIAAAPELLAAAALLEAAEDHHANCEECGGEDVPEICPECFPLFDKARLKRRAAQSRVSGEGR